MRCKFDNPALIVSTLGRVAPHSLVPLGEARLGRSGLDEWLGRAKAAA